ncbi:MAG: RNA polymerase sigma factor [Deltaproteobacteria bacterium]|nr:RNA polymerase sigma factor [Deltaproteobacteria bacterium]
MRPRTDGPSDELLLQRYQGGDPSAFGELLARHRRPVYNFILRYLGDKNQAEDLLQEVFLRIVQGAGDFKGESKFTTWLYTIARNLCIDTARKMVFRRHASLDGPTSSSEDGDGPSLMERIPNQSAAVDREAIGRELRPHLAQAVEALVHEQREVFVMREYMSLPFKEIADIVGVPENTVKSRMRYALEKLRESLAEYEDYAKALR